MGGRILDPEVEFLTFDLREWEAAYVFLVPLRIMFMQVHTSEVNWKEMRAAKEDLQKIICAYFLSIIFPSLLLYERSHSLR